MSRDDVRREKAARFMTAIAKALDGDPLTALEQRLLLQVSETLLRGDDARLLVGTEPRAQRPTDRRLALRALWCARDVAHQVAGGLTVTSAKMNTEKRWRMTEDQVRIAWLEHGREAREWAQAIGDAAKRSTWIEQQRRGAVTTP